MCEVERRVLNGLFGRGNTAWNEYTRLPLKNAKAKRRQIKQFSRSDQQASLTRAASGLRADETNGTDTEQSS
jgi:hypothetical protein